VNGDKHQTTPRDGDIGDYQSFIEHIKEGRKNPLYVFDSGDLTQV
jgi:hypothetical protein